MEGTKRKLGEGRPEFVRVCMAESGSIAEPGRGQVTMCVCMCVCAVEDRDQEETRAKTNQNKTKTWIMTMKGPSVM